MDIIRSSSNRAARIRAARIPPTRHAQVLISSLDLTKTPGGLASAYRAVSGLDTTSCERIFFDRGGLLAWFVYYYASWKVKLSPPSEDRAAIAQVFDEVLNMTIEHQRKLADEVRNVVPMRVDGQARRMLEAALNNTRQDEPDYQFEIQNPTVQRVTDFFPAFLAGAIQKHRNGDVMVAAVTLSFFDSSSVGDKLGAVMSLEVTSNEVPALARALFETAVESRGVFRYVVILPKARRYTFEGEITLRGCEREVISDIFGPAMYNAIQESRAFKDEVEQMAPSTECVTMTVSSRSDEGAVINVFLGEKEGMKIKSQLFGIPVSRS